MKLLKPKEIDWSVIQFMPGIQKKHRCALCGERPCSWGAMTKKRVAVVLCFGCGDSKGGT